MAFLYSEGSGPWFRVLIADRMFPSFDYDIRKIYDVNRLQLIFWLTIIEMHDT